MVGKVLFSWATGCTISTVTRTVLVAAGIVVEDDRVLLTQRKAGAHLAGAWEFPGGKVEAGEDPREALVRELREELGIDVVVGEIVDVAFHRYEEKAVLLLFFEARREERSPAPRALDVSPRGSGGVLPSSIPRHFTPADVAVPRPKVRARLA